MAALGVLVPRPSMRPLFDLGLVLEGGDRLNGSDLGSLFRARRVIPYLSVLFSGRRSFERQRSGFLFPASR